LIRAAEHRRAVARSAIPRRDVCENSNYRKLVLPVFLGSRKRESPEFSRRFGRFHWIVEGTIVADRPKPRELFSRQTKPAVLVCHHQHGLGPR
jgi:hypothetical protein